MSRLQHVQATIDGSSCTAETLIELSEQLEHAPCSTEGPSWQQLLLSKLQTALDCPDSCVTAEQLQERLQHLKLHITKASKRMRAGFLAAPLADILHVDAVYHARSYKVNHPGWPGRQQPDTSAQYVLEPGAKRAKRTAKELQPSLNGEAAAAEARKTIGGLRSVVNRYKQQVMRLKVQIEQQDSMQHASVSSLVKVQGLETNTWRRDFVK